ncbi:MAG: hypothetical protein V1843_00355 [bacterium]
MTEEEVLKEVISVLNSMNIPYALTGGIAVSFYGKPRSTHDFDIIIQVAPKPGSVKQIISAFKKGYYISEEGVIDALLHKTMFNILNHETGLKIDFWILKEDAYGKQAFTRRKKLKLLGIDAFILSAEDMIINKLLWYQASDIYKHLNDVQGMYEIQKNNLDQIYLSKWASKLAINHLVKDL